MDDYFIIRGETKPLGLTNGKQLNAKTCEQYFCPKILIKVELEWRQEMMKRRGEAIH